MTNLLLILTLIVTATVVLVLVAYLLGIIVALAQARASLARLAGHLLRTREDTQPLPQQLQAANDKLAALLKGLLAVNRHLQGIVELAEGARRTATSSTEPMRKSGDV